jgi:hypothetical protein
MHSPAASATHGSLAANLPGAVIGGVIFAFVSIWFIRRLARRGSTPAPVAPASGRGIFGPVLAFAAIVGLAVTASKDHHAPAPAVPPVGAPVTPPKVTIVHQAPFHFPLTGTEIVWIVVVLAVAWVAIRVNKIIHS